MSDNLKTQKFKMILIEKLCQKVKVCYFFIYFVKDSSKTFQVGFNALEMEAVQLLVL